MARSRRSLTEVAPSGVKSVFPDEVIDEVTEFMKALTDPAPRDLNAVAPATVPSGLPVDK
jgi:hypothetical protein